MSKRNHPVARHYYLRHAISILLVIGLLGSPAACILGACPIAGPADDCCPRTKTVVACPYDILSNAKVMSRTPDHRFLDGEALSETASACQTASPGLVFQERTVADGRDLHLRNRVLLI